MTSPDDELVLHLYRGSYEHDAGEFPAYAMALLAKTLHFDSARYIRTSSTPAGRMQVTSAVMYKEPIDMVLDWETINSRDKVLQTVLDAPRTAYVFHAPTLYATPDSAIVLDYARRYGHLNGVVIAAPGCEAGQMDGLSLYRADPDRQFGAVERNRVQACMPHLQNAFRINARLAVADARTAAGAGGIAIAGTDGVIQFSTPGFHSIAADEWPNRRPMRVPDALAAALRDGKAAYMGKRHRFTLCMTGGVLVIAASAAADLPRLTARESEVALLYAQGASYKEVARRLGIAPATARNVLQNIYRKLDIKDKGALATHMAAERMGRLPGART